MSRAAVDFDPSELPPPVCDYCGEEITDTDQVCTARPEGVCAP
ncbi:hypothetical protein ACKVMT_10100 [Halobacteriales archaeon Cl-PHB]